MTSLSPFHRSAILGLSREHVPLGVQARGLGLSREEVKATAKEFFDAGKIGEMPADDIRAGKAFTWPEAMLPDALDILGSGLVRSRGAITAQAEDVVTVNPPRIWCGKRITPRLKLALDVLTAGETPCTISRTELSNRLRKGGFTPDLLSIRVLISDLRRRGFAIDYNGAGYRMDDASRAAWLSGGNGDDLTPRTGGTTS